MKNSYLSATSEWTFDLIKLYEFEIGKIAKKYQLDTYPTQIEIITSEQMIDAYSAVGMPLGYHHWSYGKQFLEVEQEYLLGHMGLAYEIVINSNPCIAYLLEENTMMMQALVLAHACYGHNSFFKSNYLFTTWTNPNSIIDYLLFAKNYISDCEEKYGLSTVEEILDACHALMNYGVDRYKHPPRLSIHVEKLRQKEREDYLQSQINELWRTLPQKNSIEKSTTQECFPAEPQENILYFIEKNAPLLEPWQREIVRIVRKIAQYFYPQRQTKLMNEGWATFWHYVILNDLFDAKLVNEQFMLEFLQTHTNVIAQTGFDNPYFNGINPYALGYQMFGDIRRICQNPTEEDKEWFPDIANSDWIKTIDFSMRNFKDESFIAQFLSPKLIRNLKLFSIVDDDMNNELVISAIHDQAGYQKIRETLSNQFNLSNSEPNIQIYNVDHRGDRSLTLRHMQNNRRPLYENDVMEVMKHLYKLWGFKVKLETETEEGDIKLVCQYPAN
jgi:spore cortex formation protein SpoVR/YcgB (stage V sporulation)